MDEKAWLEKRSRELAEHTRASELYYAREEGLEQGRTEGLAEGEASGRAAEKVEMAKAMKAEGIDINTVVKVSGLSKEDIEKL